jgi:ribokinase
VITRGADGAVVADASGVTEVPSPQVEVVDTTGAGDAFTGALCLRLAHGDDLVTAARLAARVGASAVRKAGAQSSFPTLDEL